MEFGCMNLIMSFDLGFYMEVIGGFGGLALNRKKH
jgi:hypothetical protein